MKKSLFKFASALIGVLMVGAVLTGCKAGTTDKQSETPAKKEESVKLTKVRLNEVTRSIFYAPMYVAINEGYFEDEGIEIDLSIGQGADKTMQQLLSKNADIGFSGPEQVLYIYNQGREDYPVVIGQLTQKDGSFIISRESDEEFTFDNLKGKSLIGGRPGGMPQMALEYVLKNKGINKDTDLELITNVDFANVPGAFQGGTGDYAVIFEPTASVIVDQNGGSIAASIGAEAGNLPYTCFYATESYIENNPKIIEGFLRAIKRGQEFVQNEDNKKIASVIKEFFAGTDEALIEKVVGNYKEIDAFAENPILKKEDLERLMDIIQSYDSSLLETRPEYEKVVDNSFAEKVSK